VTNHTYLQEEPMLIIAQLIRETLEMQGFSIGSVKKAGA